MVLSVSVMAQQKIQLRSADKAECVKSDMRSLKASFSFSNIDAQDYESERGTFSWLSLPNTVLGGNEGDPQIPVVNELIAVPFGANPRIEITSYSTTDYRLEDYGIHTLVPRQPSLRKDQRPEDVPFVYNASAYQTRGLRSMPQAVVSVEGTMRGIQLGKMTIEPVSYDPVNNTLRVFNNIEVEVHFDGVDAAATEQMLVDTYSPYFTPVYAQMFNGRMLRDAYSEHPDLYTTPVKMLVITTSTYANNATFQEWVTWKKQKGIYVDVYTTAQTGTTAANIKSFIQTQYNQNHPTFLVIVGDSGDVIQSATGSETSKYTDLYYSSPDGDIFPDMYTCRMPVSSSDELTYMLTKTLQYEQYTMPDPSYLNETLLIAGWDSSWTPKVGKPTIQYANTYYYNSDHGITADVFLTTASGQTTCYNYINQVGFVNYTAHGGQTGWSDPGFSVSNVNSMTNTNKYFWAMGNCCLAADWGYSGVCFAEAMVRAQNKGAWGYIGSCPSTYWWEDYYFGVGATSVYNQMPTMDQTQTGVYDAMFDDSGFNTLNAVPFFGNVAVTYSHANGYTGSVTDQYYWEAYHCLGDGSVMPYQKNPSANQVSHAPTIGIGLNTFTVNALPGSYVSITKDNEILGVAEVGSTGTVNVPITPVTSSGDVLVVVTRQQRQPYMQTIPAVALNGPYIALDSYTPTTALVGQNTNLSLTFKNVGVDATTGTTNVTLTCSDTNVTLINHTGSFGALAPEATATVSGFSFCFNSGVTLGTGITFHYTAVNGSDTWEGNISISPDQIFTVTVAANNADYGTVSGGGDFHYGQSCTVNATPADGYMFTNWAINGSVVSTNASYTFNVTDNTNLVASFEEGVMIGTGTDTHEYLPSYTYYTNSLTEQIYTSAELGGAGLITSIAFYNGGAEKAQDYDFYMKATTKSSFSSKTDWIAVSAEDKVFSGRVTMVANDWTTITFSTPFIYDGTSNVVLVTDKSTQWTSSPHMSCRVFSTSSNQAIYVYDDNVDFNPMTPPSSSTNNNDVLSVKNQIIVTKSSLDGCLNVAPSTVVVGDITGNTANVTWTGYSESYNVCLGTADVVTTVEDFAGGIPARWNNSSSYPWTIVDGHMQSGNAGVHSSTSSISATVTYSADGTIEFDAECKGEGSSTIYDKCIFLIDNVQQFSYGANVSGWNHYTYNVTVGQHTFTWTYSKDGSVNPTGDYFAVDNVSMESSQVEWNTPVAVENTGYTFRGLTPETTYCVRVQGVCDGVTSAWSETVMFTTGESTTETQTVTLSEGWSWWSTNLDITLDDLKNAIKGAVGTDGTATITAQNGSITYRNGQWRGNGVTSLDIRKMYEIQTSVTCEIELTGMEVNPADYEITIVPGNNWIGYLPSEGMTLSEAFGTFPVNGDVIKSRDYSATYRNGQWRGQLTSLQPGQGYVYVSNASGNRTFTY